MEVKDDGRMEMLNKLSNTLTKISAYKKIIQGSEQGFNHLNHSLKIFVEQWDLNQQQHESREMYVYVQ